MKFIADAFANGIKAYECNDPNNPFADYQWASKRAWQNGYDLAQEWKIYEHEISTIIVGNKEQLMKSYRTFEDGMQSCEPFEAKYENDAIKKILSNRQCPRKYVETIL